MISKIVALLNTRSFSCYHFYYDFPSVYFSSKVICTVPVDSLPTVGILYSLLTEEEVDMLLIF
jgi:hypothetical protein